MYKNKTTPFLSKLLNLFITLMLFKRKKSFTQTRLKQDIMTNFSFFNPYMDFPFPSINLQSYE